MLLKDFVNHYPTEESCRLDWKSKREKAGIACRKCKNVHHYWCKSIEKWQCKQCGYQTSLKSGTVMEHSNLPIGKWYLCIHLMSATKKGFSALEMQRQLGHPSYQPVWEMMHKIRRAMGSRDDRYKLKGGIELDDAFFEQVITDEAVKEEVERDGLKRGKGSQKQAKVVAMIGSKKVEEGQRKKGRKAKKCNYLKMKVVDDLKSGTVNGVVEKTVDANGEVDSDSAKGFGGIGELVGKHTAHNLSLPGVKVEKVLPWVHTAIGNAKRNLLDVYHMVSDRYVQQYLNEFCYRFNRRWYEGRVFDRLMVACLDYDPENGDISEITVNTG